MSKHILRTLFGVVVIALFLAHAGEYRRIPLIDRLEALAYDVRLSRTMPGTAYDRVVILDIDEKSLLDKELGDEGRWPWPRDRLALLMDKLFDRYQVAVVGLDIVFAMAQTLSQELRDKRFRAPALLRRLVLAGQVGKKCKLGLYDYRGPEPQENPECRAFASTPALTGS